MEKVCCLKNWPNVCEMVPRLFENSLETDHGLFSL